MSKRFIAKSLVESIKKKPMTRFEAIAIFGDSATKALQYLCRDGYIGKTLINNTNKKVYATKVYLFHHIKDYEYKQYKSPETRFRNRPVVYLNDKQLETYQKLGGYKWLRAFLDGVDL